MPKRSKKRGRRIDGILLLDKPTGGSSNHYLQCVSRLFYAKKAGHTGSLDPLASGMLPICLGEATKVSNFLLEADKAYAVTARLGVTTDTYDSDGKVVDTRPVDRFEAAEIDAALVQFRGNIGQIPPMYSALKHRGRPLYQLARSGQHVVRKARPVHIKTLAMTAINGDSLSLYVECSKGTYIRSLVMDIGEALGCGAHVTQLRRQWVQPFAGESVYTLEKLESLAKQGLNVLDKALLPIEKGLALPSIQLSVEAAKRLLMGQTIDSEAAQIPESLYCLADTEGRFLGVGRCQQVGRLTPKRTIETFFDPGSQQ